MGGPLLRKPPTDVHSGPLLSVLERGTPVGGFASWSLESVAGFLLPSLACLCLKCQEAGGGGKGVGAYDGLGVTDVVLHGRSLKTRVCPAACTVSVTDPP